MKTTLDLDDELLRRSRQRAAQEGVTFTRFVEDALALRLEDSRQEPAFRLALAPVRGTRPPNVDISDREALYEVLDRG